MRPRILLRVLPALLALLLAAGCGRDAGSLLSAETDDSNYARGKELLKQGRDQEALTAFLKVIAARGDDAAPESHLEAGLLYQEKLKDPVAAIYHYRKFCELVPASPQTGLVRQQIDAALREFARTLPGQPLDSQSGDLLATVARLQAENKQLRDQLAATPSGRAVRTPGPSAVIAPVPPPGDSPIRPAPPPPSATPAVAARKHVVAAGETLSTLAQKYYGNRGKWPDILAANKDILPSEKTPLKIGMELKIP
jgi:nucleoid-associated protein YgaU